MKISVVIPAYNGEKYIGECITSVLKQTRLPDQIAVIIDESHDDTEKICKSFGQKIEIYHNSPATGFVDAWNRAIKKATFDWICLLHQDDLLTPDFLLTAETIVSQKPDAKFIYALCNYIDKDGNFYNEPQEDEPKWICQRGADYIMAYMNHKANRCPGVIAKKEVFQRFPFRNEPGLVADNDFFWRVGSYYDVVRINRQMASFRHHPDSATHTFHHMNESLFYEYIWLYRDYIRTAIFSSDTPFMRILANWIISHGTTAIIFALQRVDFTTAKKNKLMIISIRHEYPLYFHKKTLSQHLFLSKIPLPLLFFLSLIVKLIVKLRPHQTNK